MSEPDAIGEGPRQLTRAELEGMSRSEVREARMQGRFADLLAGRDGEAPTLEPDDDDAAGAGDEQPPSFGSADQGARPSHRAGQIRSSAVVARMSRAEVRKARLAGQFDHMLAHGPDD